jgi:hypothetical protein
VTNISDDELQKAYANEAANIPKFGGKVSELCKYVWVGSLAIAYTLATADKPIPAFSGGQKYILIAAAGAGSLALLFDYLQYLSAYLHARRFVRWIESSSGPIELKVFNGKTVSIFSYANSCFFWAKNFAVFISAILIVVAMLRILLQ